MDLQTSMSKSATNFANNEIGYSLKKRKLYQWIYSHQLTQPYVAKQMGIEHAEFQTMLNKGVKFNREQITRLVKLMGARDAFDAIYFPTAKQREEVYQKTFGSCLSSRESDNEESTDEEATTGQKVFRKDEEAELIYLFENEKPMRKTFPDWYFTDCRYTINHSKFTDWKKRSGMTWREIENELGINRAECHVKMQRKYSWTMIDLICLMEMMGVKELFDVFEFPMNSLKEEIRKRIF